MDLMSYACDWCCKDWLLRNKKIVVVLEGDQSTHRIGSRRSALCSIFDRLSVGFIASDFDIFTIRSLLKLPVPLDQPIDLDTSCLTHCTIDPDK